MRYANWPIEELVIELAQILAASAAAGRIHDIAKADGKERLIKEYTYVEYHNYMKAYPVWRAILDKGGVVPERLRRQYLSMFDDDPYFCGSTADVRRWEQSEFERHFPNGWHE